jgi:hypothetical protein
VKHTALALLLLLLLLLLALALTLAGCGSGGGKSAGEEGTTLADVAANQRDLDKQLAYDYGGKTCIQYSLEEAAELYGVKPEPKALADAVAKTEPDPELSALVRKGCLDAFK